MSLVDSLKKAWKRKGFRQFIKKVILLTVIFFLLPLLLFPVLEHMRYEGKIEYNGRQVVTDPLPFYLVDIGAALIFAGLTFIAFSRKKLLDISFLKEKDRKPFIYILLCVISLISYLALRYYTSHNPRTSFDYRWLFVVAIVLSLLLFGLLLIISVFGPRYSKYFFGIFKKEIILSSILVVAYYFITTQLRLSWIILGNIVSNAVAFLLGLTFDDVVLTQKGLSYVLGAEGFIAQIGDICSGIDSMGLFIGLFILILALDWHKINKKRMIIIFLPGLIGTIIMNIIRIYLLYLSGIFISREFAVGMFHSNAGWILFIFYFILFWSITYSWVKNE